MSTEIVDIESTALSLPDQAKAFATITTAEAYAQAGELLVTVKELRKQIAAHHQPMIDAGLRAHREALAARKRLDDPLDRVEGLLDAPMRIYLAAERRQREEATRIAEAAARQAEEDARLAEAAHAEQAGEHAEAEAIISVPVVVPSVVLPKAVPKVAGLATTTDWLWKITDEKKIPRLYYDLAEARINAVVRTNKKLAEQMIPGIEVYSIERPRGARK